ncbi:MAG: family N-acetyltransferase [Pedosphaera sp.]|nr:family N-acetyltransferase [Pedosphaera sp.]
MSTERPKRPSQRVSKKRSRSSALAETTSRVLIRPPTAADCITFLAAVRRSRSLHQPWVSPPNTQEKYGHYLERHVSHEHWGFLVIHKDTNDLVGVVNINHVICGNLLGAYLGYYAFAPFAGKGLMREGIMLVLDYAFRKMKLHRLEANIQPENKSSIALAKKCGFVKEGFSKRYLKIGGRWRDHERWAILAETFKRPPDFP